MIRSMFVGFVLTHMSFLKHEKLIVIFVRQFFRRSSTAGFRMPRVGDSEAFSVWFDSNLYRYGMGYMPTFLYWSRTMRCLGDPFMAWNLLWLVLDKIDSPMARPFTWGRI